MEKQNWLLRHPDPNFSPGETLFVYDDLKIKFHTADGKKQNKTI